LTRQDGGVHDDLIERRSDYPVLATSTYLVNNSLGAMHRDTATRLAEYADLWATHGVKAWFSHWLPEMRRVADLVGAIIGAPPGSTVLGANVSTLLGALVSALDFPARRADVVTTNQDWPGSHYFWSEHQRRTGGDLVVVPAHDDGIGVDVGRVVDAIGPRTRVVSLSHVHFRTSYVMDLEPAVARAHEVGAFVVVDAYQSAGILPLDVAALGVDACVGGSVKYLCGGPGNGWLYVRPDVATDLRPALVGWFGHARPFDFTMAEVEYAPGVERFTGGTPNVPAAYAAAPGYQAVLDVGVDRVRERSLSLTQPLLEGALERGYTVRSPADPTRRAGHVTIDPGDSSRVHDELLRAGFVVDHRPGSGIRVGPHFFNTADECAALLTAIDNFGPKLS
jgi:kynureninase